MSEPSDDRRVLVFGSLPPELSQRLAAHYPLVAIGDLMAPVPGIRAAVTTSMVGATDAMMALGPDLKLIACNGAGLEAIDLPAAASRGIEVVNTPDAVTQDTAEFAIALLMSVGRRLPQADAFVRSGAWSHSRMAAGSRLSGRTLGLVGMGRIGTVIASLAAALGLKVRYYARRAKVDLPYPYSPDIISLAAESDFLVLALSVGPDAVGLVDAAVLQALGPQGFLINVSRGAAVDEAALLDALRNRTIAGAALDVFQDEPDLNPAFFGLENALLTPHFAAVTTETRRAMADQILKSIDGMLRE